VPRQAALGKPPSAGGLTEDSVFQAEYQAARRAMLGLVTLSRRVRRRFRVTHPSAGGRIAA
jgi:hypothetical protein